MQTSKTIVINCAGIGARLGFGHTKALLRIAGKPIIIHHLEQLNKFDDVRVVVGFGAKDVINTVLEYRKNVTFVFNHDYLHTHTLSSLYLGSRYSNKYIVSLDGDLIIDPLDLKNFLEQTGEVIGYNNSYSDDAVFVKIASNNKTEFVTEFSITKKFNHEWTGLVQIKVERIYKNSGYVYQILKPILPVRAKFINCREIDTPNDYEKAIEWSKKIFK